MSAIAKTMAHRKVSEGDALIVAGEPIESLHVVVSGTYRLVRFLADGRRQIIGFAFPGDYLGIAETRNSHYSAEALDPGLVCSFSHKFLNQAAQRHPGIKDRLIARGDTELNKAQDHIVLLGKQSAEEKLISFFTLLQSKRHRADMMTDELFLPMSRQDIADYLGLRLETLSRTLAALKKSGIIQEVSGRSIRLGAPFASTT